MLGNHKSGHTCTTIMKYEVLYLGKESRCLHAICHDSVDIHSLITYELTVTLIPKFPTINPLRTVVT